MIDKQASFSSSDFNKWSLVVILFIAVVVIMIVIAVRGSARELEKVQRIETPEEIIFQYKGMKRKLGEEEKLTFLKQFHLPGIISHNSYRLEPYSVYIRIIVNQNEEHNLILVPDSSQKGEYWLFKVGKSRKIHQFHSYWLPKWFKENGFFDHEKILP